MTSFMSSIAPAQAVERFADAARLDSWQEKKLREFLEVLAPDQLTVMYRTGAIIDVIADKEPLPQIQGEISFADASEHKPFDFATWNSQKDHRIR